ncbi:MAG TPA: CRTAC1 family protein, partial [Myxococcota bacterium]|nr:CRTAC1 family protein [Myxococcota bacterium]
QVQAGKSCTASGVPLQERHLPPAEGDRTGQGAAVGDLDGDGWLDIFVANHPKNRILRGGPDGFTEEKDVSGASEVTESVAMADMDADGDLDVFLGGEDGAFVLVNDGDGAFPELHQVSTKQTWTLGGAWGDLNGDARLDLLVCNHAAVRPTKEDFEANLLPGGDGSELLFGDGKGGFRDESAQLASVADLYPSTCLMQDLDADQDLDLYFVNDFGPWSGPNRVLWNDGEGNFSEEEAGTSGLEIEIMGMGVAVASLDGGPLPSLLLSSWAEMKLLEPAEGGWVDGTLARGFALEADQQLAWGVELPDLDNDGDVDAAITFGALPGSILADDFGFSNPQAESDVIFTQEGGQFTQTSAWRIPDPSMGRGLISADLDRNGSLDLVVTALDDGVHIYQSDCPTANWLRVRLAQRGPNRDAIGARVELVAGGHTQVAWLHAGGTTFASSGPAELHFGLGEATEVESIRVIWPDGHHSEVGTQPINSELLLTRQ